MAPRNKLVAIHPIHGYVIKPQEDLKTIKRNSRERNRVETVNRGFDTLRQHVPSAAMVKKMSKVNILQHALEYIKNLCHILDSCQEPQPLPASYVHSYPSPYPSPYLSYSPALTPNYHTESGYESQFYGDSQHSPSLSQSSWQHSPSLIKQEQADSTTTVVSKDREAESSGEEDDVLDAIVEWQTI